MAQRDFYLAPYDVTHPRRLAAALALVRGYTTCASRRVWQSIGRPPTSVWGPRDVKGNLVLVERGGEPQQFILGCAVVVFIAQAEWLTPFPVRTLARYLHFRADDQDDFFRLQGGIKRRQVIGCGLGGNQAVVGFHDGLSMSNRSSVVR